MVLDTPTKIAQYRFLTLHAALKLQVKGLKRSKGPSALAILRKERYVTSRTVKGALEEMEVIRTCLGLDSDSTS